MLNRPSDAPVAAFIETTAWFRITLPAKSRQDPRQRASMNAPLRLTVFFCAALFPGFAADLSRTVYCGRTTSHEPTAADDFSRQRHDPAWLRSGPGGRQITYLAASGSQDNVVNSFDFGRQIQMSFYSGPTPFTVGDKRPAKHWEHLGWNPIQSGDDFGHGSTVIEHKNDGKTLYVRCIPLQWPLDNVPAECTFESWITLSGSTAQVRSRLNNFRVDTTQYRAKRQELPAIYTNGPFYRLITYAGDKPFTGDGLKQILSQPANRGPGPVGRRPSAGQRSMRDDQWGLGVWSPGCSSYGGGFAGEPGHGGPKDNPTGYIAPGHVEVIDHNIPYEYRYALILGTVEEIRRYVYEQARPPARPDYRFEKDRQHWHFVNATDNGWPIDGELHVRLESDDPQLVGPSDFWHAADVAKLSIEAAFQTKQRQAQLFWSTHAEPGFAEDKSVRFDIEPDGKFHVYEVLLESAPTYRGAITGLNLIRCHPADQVKRCGSSRFRRASREVAGRTEDMFSKGRSRAQSRIRPPCEFALATRLRSIPGDWPIRRYEVDQRGPLVFAAHRQYRADAFPSHRPGSIPVS